MEIDGSLELVCLKGGWRDAIRARIPPRGPTVIVRPGLSKVRPIAAEVFTVEVERSWTFGHTRHVKGLITETRFDLARLELEPLELYEGGSWDPGEYEWLVEEGDHELYEEIQAAGPRAEWEMEQVLPEDVVELRWEEDPIVEAAALVEAGASDEAEDVLGELLTADLRCLDAHAHLGNIEFRRSWGDALGRAARHHRAGVEIAGLTVGDDFRDVLPWGLIDNRPYLRCLHGHGLCLWRQGEMEAARRVFERMLWLNPLDNQGARFLIAAVEAGVAWEDRGELREPG